MRRERLGGPILFLPRVVSASFRRVTWFFATLRHRLTVGCIGSGSRIQPGVRFIVPQRIFLGRKCLVWKGVAVSADGPCAELRLGDGVEINADVHLDASGRLEIGDHSLISEESVIYTHDHGLDPRSAPQCLDKQIGAHVWIGMRALILARCQSIGDHAVIGGGAIVTRNVAAGAIVAGNPARVIGWCQGYDPSEDVEEEA